MLIICVMTQCR